MCFLYQCSDSIYLVWFFFFFACLMNVIQLSNCLVICPLLPTFSKSLVRTLNIPWQTLNSIEGKENFQKVVFSLIPCMSASQDSQVLLFHSYFIDHHLPIINSAFYQSKEIPTSPKKNVDGVYHLYFLSFMVTKG